MGLKPNSMNPFKTLNSSWGPFFTHLKGDKIYLLPSPLGGGYRVYYYFRLQPHCLSVCFNGYSTNN